MLVYFNYGVKYPRRTVLRGVMLKLRGDHNGEFANLLHEKAAAIAIGAAF